MRLAANVAEIEAPIDAILAKRSAVLMMTVHEAIAVRRAFPDAEIKGHGLPERRWCSAHETLHIVARLQDDGHHVDVTAPDPW
jgi:hypothetical protein